MSKHTYDFIEGQIPMAQFQEQTTDQANRALCNLQMFFSDMCQRTPFCSVPGGLLNCKSAGEAHIEWIELLLVEAVADHIYSRYNRTDIEWCEDFSHHVISILRNNGVGTLLQLYQKTKKELFAIEGVGKITVKCLRDVQHWLDTCEPDGGLPAAS